MLYKVIPPEPEPTRRRHTAQVDIPMMRLCAVLLVSLLGSLVSVHAAVAPHPHWSVGYHRMSVLDPLDSQPMKAIAFYPSTGQEHVSQVGAYRVAATEDAKVAIGRFPLLMLSHGNTGTPLALHDLATSLARKGFVVVAVLHPGDNYKDHSRLHPLAEKRSSHLRDCLAGNDSPVIAVTGYPQSVVDPLAAHVDARFVALGAGSVQPAPPDRYWIAALALKALAEDGRIEPQQVERALRRYPLG